MRAASPRRRSAGVCHARRLCLLEAGHRPPQNQSSTRCARSWSIFRVSTVAYFFLGFAIAYGTTFLVSAEALSGGGNGFDPQGYTLVKFFFLLTFAAATPAIVSGGIAERARFLPQCVATGLIVGLFYPFFEGIVWNKNFGLQEAFFETLLGESSTILPGLDRRARRRRLDQVFGPSSSWGLASRPL